MSTENIKQPGIYYSIIDGTFRRRVQEGTEGAVKREYETPKGEKGVKHEIIVKDIIGFVRDINIFEGDYGRNLQITLDPNEQGVSPKLQISVENNYGEDMLKKLPNVDFKKEVSFTPFAFTDEKTGRDIRGVTIMQDNEKIKGFFYDPDKGEPINGMPGIPDKARTEFSKDDWKMHFLNVRKFLIDYFEKNVHPRFVRELENQVLPQRQPAQPTQSTGTQPPAGAQEVAAPTQADNNQVEEDFSNIPF